MDGTEFGLGLGDAILYSSDDTPKMMKKLRQFVEADAQKVPSECIDSVLWFVYDEEEPTARMWHVLDGLSPKHLEMFTSA